MNKRRYLITRETLALQTPASSLSAAFHNSLPFPSLFHYQDNYRSFQSKVSLPLGCVPQIQKCLHSKVSSFILQNFWFLCLKATVHIEKFEFQPFEMALTLSLMPFFMSRISGLLWNLITKILHIIMKWWNIWRHEEHRTLHLLTK